MCDKHLQRTPDQGVDYCRRKVNMLKENLDKIGQVQHNLEAQMSDVHKMALPLASISYHGVVQVIKEKNQQLTMVNQMLQGKIQAAQAAQQSS